MAIAAVLLAGFALGVAIRARCQRRVAIGFRLHNAVGLSLFGFLSGWSYKDAHGDVLALGVLLLGQLVAVAVGLRLFRRDTDGPLMAFSLYGSPGFWAVPVTAAMFGTRAAVVVAAYDMLTQPRLALAMRFMRTRAPTPQRRASRVADYLPMTAAIVGLATSKFATSPAAVSHAVVVLSVGLSTLAAVLLGAAWPFGAWFGSVERRLVTRVLALHLTVLPGWLLIAALAGVDVPAGAWVLALGPIPLASLLFARLYGYSARFAASGLVISAALATALLPLASALTALSSE